MGQNLGLQCRDLRICNSAAPYDLWKRTQAKKSLIDNHFDVLCYFIIENMRQNKIWIHGSMHWHASAIGAAARPNGAAGVCLYYTIIGGRHTYMVNYIQQQIHGSIFMIVFIFNQLVCHEMYNTGRNSESNFEFVTSMKLIKRKLYI